jgi:protein gp37
MATVIEWTDETWNPTDGCSVCSPGCANCYAMRFAGRFAKPGERYHGLVKIGKNKRAVWTGELRLDSGKLAKPLHWRRPRKVFVNSMSDLFHENLSNEQIAAVFGVMAACPQHTFQVLTKRAKRMTEWFEWFAGEANESALEVHGMALRDAVTQELVHTLADCASRGLGDGSDGDQGNWFHRLTGAIQDPMSARSGNIRLEWPLRNVWLGVSVENQDAADDRIPELLATPAAVRFLSCEPLLSSVSMFAFLRTPLREKSLRSLGVLGPAPGIGWVIAGCESGPGARPCAVADLRSLRDECSAAGVPFFLKQAREAVAPIRLDGSHEDEPPYSVGRGYGSTAKTGGVIGLPYLDGKQHAEFPK